MTTWPKRITVDLDLTQRWRDLGFWIDQPITQLFDQHVASRPDQLCFIDSRREITYHQLQTLGYQLAVRRQQV